MTPIESIYEIRSSVLDLQRHLVAKKPVVYHRAYERYEKLVDRFFRESVNVFEPERRMSLRIECLDDSDYFLNLLESTMEYYDDMN
jgi:hypothetical protein